MTRPAISLMILSALVLATGCSRENAAPTAPRRANLADATSDTSDAVAEPQEPLEVDVKPIEAQDPPDTEPELELITQSTADLTESGMRHIKNGAYDQAIATLTEALRRKHDDAVALNGRGTAWYGKGDYDRAIADYTQAIRLKRDFVAAYRNRAAVFLKKGDSDQAIADFTETLRLKQDDAAAFHDRGTAWYRKGDYDRAIADYTEALRLKPDFALSYRNRASARLEASDYDPAIADFTETIRLKQGDALALRERGVAWYRKGDCDRAIADFTEAVRLKGDDALAYRHRAVVCLEKGDYDRAIADFTETLRLKQPDVEALNDRGTAWSGKGDYDRAIADYTEAVRLKPDFAVAYRNRAAAHLKKRDYDQAIADFTETLRLKQDDAVAFNDRGTAWYRKGDYDRAITDYTEALRLKPDYALALGNRGNAWSAKGNSVRTAADHTSATLLRAVDRAKDGVVRAVPETLLFDHLQRDFAENDDIRIVVSVPADESRPTLRLHVFSWSLEDGTAEEHTATWSSEVSTQEVWPQTAQFLASQSEYLEAALEWGPHDSTFFEDRYALKLCYRLPRGRDIQVDETRRLKISPNVLHHLKVSQLSDYPAARRAVIIAEAHNNLNQQFAIFKGMEALFAENPWLRESGATAFLTEAWPAGESLSVAPLVHRFPQPDDAMVFEALSSWLIPGYVAFEWKHQFGICLVGHEDARLYRLCNYLHWLCRSGRLAGDEQRLAGRIEGLSVTARNQASAETFLNMLETYPCPFLFIGFGHVGPYHADEAWLKDPATADTLSPEQWPQFTAFVSQEEVDVTRKASRRSIVSYLKERNIGYILLEPRNDPFPDQKIKNREFQQYTALRGAQQSGKVGEYLKGLAEERRRARPDPAASTSDCTVIPSPADAAEYLASLDGIGPGAASPINSAATSRRVTELLQRYWAGRPALKEKLEQRIAKAVKARKQSHEQTEEEAREKDLFNVEKKARGQAAYDALKSLEYDAPDTERNEFENAAEQLRADAEEAFAKRWNKALKSRDEMEDHVKRLVEEVGRLSDLGYQHVNDVAAPVEVHKAPNPIEVRFAEVGDPLPWGPERSDGSSAFGFDQETGHPVIVIGSDVCRKSRYVQLLEALHEIEHYHQYMDLARHLGDKDAARRRWEAVARAKGTSPEYWDREFMTEYNAANRLQEYLKMLPDSAAKETRSYKDAARRILRELLLRARRAKDAASSTSQP